MSKWEEDTIYEITMSIKDRGVEQEFYSQLNKMKTQPEWKHKTVAERFEYAYKAIVTNK
tara:strand:+ start:113 stop:289 length:177 start_codon:yes stop_codon:yes gene_type:complete